jgi:hypothetical protein
MVGLQSRATVAGALAFVCLILSSPAARAWGDEGHEIVALIADHYLDPTVRQKVRAMLAADTDNLTAHDIASEATWADKYRDSDRQTTKERYNRTHNWHYVDIELTNPDIGSACFGAPQLANGTPASNGAADDCVTDKIKEFAAELRAPDTTPEERLIALKFLLHFVGDTHQPLHAADDNDAGGNGKRVSAEGFRANKLHHFWDTEFVAQVNPDPQQAADQLIAAIGEAPAEAHAPGDPIAWAQESFALARDHAYGKLPAPNERGSYRLDAGYISDATDVVKTQLSKAGVRLAGELNQALGQ